MVGVGTAVAVVALGSAVLSAPLASAQTTKMKDKTVVEVVNRSPYGDMLATVKGASLYTPPASGCSGGCLKVWPPLYVKKNTTPTGTSGLGTVEVVVGKKDKFQVTYNGKSLYTFTGDSGSSVNGNGVGGFSVATVG
jgi:predicted lipoprotein with Yx(FWY)xxD motif